MHSSIGNEVKLKFHSINTKNSKHVKHIMKNKQKILPELMCVCKRERRRITGLVFLLKPTLIKTEAKVDKRMPHPIARKPIYQLSSLN